MLVTREQAEATFQPHYAIIRKAFVDAFQHYFKVHEPELTKIHERTKASYINDLIYDGLVEALSKAPNVRTQIIYGQRRLWFEETLCVRLKKLNQNKRPRLNPSQMSSDFLRQEFSLGVQLALPGMPPPTNLFIGYTVNPTRTAVTGVYIVCINGDEFEWEPILIPETGATTPAPVPPPSLARQGSGHVRVRK